MSYSVSPRRWWSLKDRKKAKLLQTLVNSPDFGGEVDDRIAHAWKNSILYGTMLSPLQGYKLTGGTDLRLDDVQSQDEVTNTSPTAPLPTDSKDKE